MTCHSIPRGYFKRSISIRRHHCSQLAWRRPLSYSVVARSTMDFDWQSPGLGVARRSLDATPASKRPSASRLKAPSASRLKRRRRGYPGGSGCAGSGGGEKPREITVGSGCAGLLTEGWALRSIGVRCVHAFLGMTSIAPIITLNRDRKKIWCSCPDEICFPIELRCPKLWWSPNGILVVVFGWGDPCHPQGLQSSRTKS